MKAMRQLEVWMIGVLIIFSGCSSRTQSSSTLSENSPVNVKVQKIETGTGNGASSYIGTIEESVSIPLSFSVPGTVTQVLFDEGQSVAKGQLLAALNSESYQNAYKASEAKYNQALDAYNRLEPVYKKGSLPEVKFVEIQTGLEQAKSMASISEKDVKDCKLYAPTSGIIGRRMIEPGMSVIPGNAAFELVKIDKVFVKIPVPEKEISEMKKGQDVKIKVAALGSASFEGKITEIGVLSNPLSHTYTVKAEIKNQENQLMPGMVCETYVANPTIESRLVVPLNAVQEASNGEKFVFVADQGTKKVSKKKVETGTLVSNGIVIKSGLVPGDLLVVEGYQKISDHSSVQF